MLLPDAPVLTFTRGSVILNWTDGTPVDYANPATWGNPKNEIGFRIERADVVNGVRWDLRADRDGPGERHHLHRQPARSHHDLQLSRHRLERRRVISRSNELMVPGLPKATTTVVTSSLNPSNVGDNVTFTATVSPAGGYRHGDRSTSTASTSVRRCHSPAGMATFSTRLLLLAGTHPVIAAYSGDASLPAQHVRSLSQVVSQGGFHRPL